MKEYSERYKAILKDWKQILDVCDATPTQFDSYVSDITIQDVDSLVKLLGQWFDRKIALNGTRPILDIVKAVLVAELDRVKANSGNLAAGSYGEPQWRGFISGLGQIFTAIQSAALFEEGEKGDKGDAQVLYTALLETHVEVQKAMDQANGFSSDVEGYQATFDLASSNAAEISSKLEECETSLQAIQKNEEAAVKSSSQIAEIETSFIDQRNLTDDMLGEFQGVQADLKAKREVMDTQLEEVKNIQDSCNALLKSATTAGLTLAFAERAGKVSNGRRLWGGAFILSVLVISWIAFLLVPDLKAAADSGGDMLTPILKRLPVTLPLIWLAWFSAVQYGNNLRLQEDYEFKASTCKAFEGFHKHFEVLEKYPDGEAASALKTLAQNTIKTLAQEPGRKLGKSDKDVSFWTALFNAWFGKTSSGQSGSGTGD